MATLKASKFKAALKRARRAGRYEEATTIAEIPLVFCNLGPEDLYKIQAALDPDGMSGAEYASHFQMEHVARSIVEVDGQDLREVDFIEQDTEDGKTVNVEKHEWLKENLIATWGSEMVKVAFRKVLDAQQRAEEMVNAGVTFRLQTETAEDKFHRLLNELMEVGSDLPLDLKEAILKEHGLAPLTTKEELAQLNEEAKRFLEEKKASLGVDDEPEAEPQAEPEPEPAPVFRPPVVRVPTQILQAAEQEVDEEPPPPAPVPTGPVARPRNVRDMLASRQPMNRTAIAHPIPSQPPEAQAKLANPRSPAPPADQVVSLASASRAAQYAALENDAAASGVGLDMEAGIAAYDLSSGNAVVLDDKVSTAIDKATLVFDKPPVSGANPKFVDPHRNAGLNPRTRR